MDTRGDGASLMRSILGDACSHPRTRDLTSPSVEDFIMILGLSAARAVLVSVY